MIESPVQPCKIYFAKSELYDTKYPELTIILFGIFAYFENKTSGDFGVYIYVFTNYKASITRLSQPRSVKFVARLITSVAYRFCVSFGRQL